MPCRQWFLEWRTKKQFNALLRRGSGGRGVRCAGHVCHDSIPDGFLDVIGWWRGYTALDGDAVGNGSVDGDAELPRCVCDFEVDGRTSGVQTFLVEVGQRVDKSSPVSGSEPPIF